MHVCGCAHMHRNFTQQKPHEKSFEFCISLQFVEMHNLVLHLKSKPFF